MLEANHPGRDFAGKQSLGRPGRLERRLLPDPQGHDRQRHVRLYPLRRSSDSCFALADSRFWAN